jgi:hypothetical protein
VTNNTGGEDGQLVDEWEEEEGRVGGGGVLRRSFSESSLVQQQQQQPMVSAKRLFLEGFVFFCSFCEHFL